MEEADSSSQNMIGNTNEVDKKILNPTSHNSEVSTTQWETEFTCSLYISRAGGIHNQGHNIQGNM